MRFVNECLKVTGLDACLLSSLLERRFKSQPQGLGFEIRSGVSGGGENKVPRFLGQRNSMDKERPCTRDVEGFGGVEIAGQMKEKEGVLVLLGHLLAPLPQ